MNNNYFRKFLTLSHENGQSGKAFGTFILERRNNINKITLNISNIRPNIEYCLTLVKVFENNAKFIDIKTFRSDENGNVSIKSEIDTKVFKNIEIDCFDVCLIKINTTKELITPLVAYFDKTIKWREFFVPINEKGVLTSNKNEFSAEKAESEILEPIVTKPYNFGFNTTDNKNIKTVVAEIENEESKDSTCSICPNNTVLSKSYSLKNNKFSENNIDSMSKKINLPNIKPLKTDNFILNPVDDCDELDHEEIHHNTDSGDMIEKLKHEIENLKNLAINSYEKDTKSSYENIELLPCTINELFDKGEKIKPFNLKGKDVDWIIIDFSDLILIDNAKTYSKNPFFRNSYKKFSHFILGKLKEMDKEIYMIGVPDFFNHEYEKSIRDLGFITFKESVGGIQQGYWISLL